MAETQIVYKPSPGARMSRVDAQLVGQSLQAIVDRDGGVEPQTVLNEAKAADSLLHKFFTWDDSEAARRFRLEEARRLIRSVRVIVQREENKAPLEVRAFVRVASEAKNHYLPVARVLGDEDMRHQLLAKALLELQAFRTRYATLSELAVLFETLDGLPFAKTA